ncbi:kinase-like domain-containing protein [Nemania sp. FL0916]|nr:kinase-like domain-containing protein [Nemania sp. FL0916]
MKIKIIDRIRRSKQRISEDTSGEGAEQQVEHLIRSAMQAHLEITNPICQHRVIQNVLSRDEIIKLFRWYQRNNQTEWGKRNIENLCNEVCLNNIKVLAMLILIGKGSALIHLIDEGVSDSSLPLVYTDMTKGDLRLASQQDTLLECFSTWTTQMRLDICRMQWELDVPYMKMGPHYLAEHTEFSDDVILPWCKQEQNTSEAGQTTSKTDKSTINEGFGGYSSVNRVYIHPEYHGFHDILKKIGLVASCANRFALKTLNPESDKELETAYMNEIEQLKNLNGTVAKHLVTLLTTFTHKKKRNFLFPWASSDLFSYWETEKTYPEDLSYIRWFSRQLKGLVDAVHAIHWPSAPRSVPGSTPRNFYGRHGDLKPDNILWYQKDDTSKDPHGILVVSDMGFTVAHTTYSRSKDHASRVARTPEYRPPELDTKNEPVTRKYDVWTLGCIFLEMLTWFLGGKEERDEFKNKRKTTEWTGANTYVFFALEKGEGSGVYATVKRQVVEWMEKIRKHKYRSQFTDDVVNVIQSDMILVKDRTDIRDLKDKFTEINKRCQDDPTYAKATARCRA